MGGEGGFTKRVTTLPSHAPQLRALVMISSSSRQTSALVLARRKGAFRNFPDMSGNGPVSTSTFHSQVATGDGKK